MRPYLRRGALGGYLERVMTSSHRDQVEALLAQARAEHDRLRAALPSPLRESLPVDAQGITRAIDYVASVAGFTVSQRRALVRPHAVNPAVLHARVFGGAPLAPETVIGAFVEGARVRADALAALADATGGDALGQEIRKLLTAHPPPVGTDDGHVVSGLRDTYAAQERAVVRIATNLDQI